MRMLPCGSPLPSMSPQLSVVTKGQLLNSLGSDLILFGAGGSQFVAPAGSSTSSVIMGIPTREPAEAVHVATAALRRALARHRAPSLLPAYQRARVPPSKPYELSAEDEGRRALASTLLGYAAALGTTEALAALSAHYHDASNMTDTSVALALLASTECEQRQPALDHFEAKWRGHREVRPRPPPWP